MPYTAPVCVQCNMGGYREGESQRGGCMGRLAANNLRHLVSYSLSQIQCQSPAARSLQLCPVQINLFQEFAHNHASCLCFVYLISHWYVENPSDKRINTPIVALSNNNSTFSAKSVLHVQVHYHTLLHIWIEMKLQWKDTKRHKLPALESLVTFPVKCLWMYFSFLLNIWFFSLILAQHKRLNVSALHSCIAPVTM